MRIVTCPMCGGVAAAIELDRPMCDWTIEETGAEYRPMCVNGCGFGRSFESYYSRCCGQREFIETLLAAALVDEWYVSRWRCETCGGENVDRRRQSLPTLCASERAVKALAAFRHPIVFGSEL